MTMMRLFWYSRGSVFLADPDITSEGPYLHTRHDMT